MNERLSSPGLSSSGSELSARLGESPATTLRRLGPAIAGYGLPFVLVLYLALRNGGYDSVVRSEIGIAIWWLVLLGAVVGVLPVARITRAGWVALALLGGFALWTGLAIGWSESSERSVTELARVATYLGVFALALSAQGAAGLRRAVYSVGAAIAAIGILALLSRLHPGWFPENQVVDFLPDARSRLSYPLNYWNGLATLIAIGVPLLLVIATAARATLTRALAAASVPALCLAAYYTLSRGGAVELGVALIAVVALHPRRLALIGTLVISGLGATLAIVAASQRDQLADGLNGQLAQSQGDEMLAFLLVVCVGVGLVQAALSLAARYELGPRLEVSRRHATTATALAAVVAVFIAVAAGLPGELSDKWQEFKDPTAGVEASTAERFESASGSGRYQYWQSALDANASEPLGGIGPGTFEFWFARDGTIPGFVRDAHSLYFESLAEVGVVGFALITGLILMIVGVGAWRTMRSTDSEHRALLAAGTAACLAFAVGAAVDWVWELAVLPVAFLILAAALLSRSDGDEGGRPRPRILLGAVAAAALVAIAIPLAGASSIRDSQQSARANALDQALGDARTAGDIEPYAATPSFQEALVLELQGDFDSAVAAARRATEEEPTNWRTWLALSRLEARTGDANAALAAFREARNLNPRSPLFAGE